MTLTANDFRVIGATAGDIANLNAALAYLQQSPVAAAILQQMAQNGTTININARDQDTYNPPVGAPRYNPNFPPNSINWDPNSGQIVSDANGTILGVQSAALSLLHEAAHATDPNFNTNAITPNSQYDDNAEQYAIGQEDAVAQQLGEPQRFNHHGGAIDDANPTDHTISNGDGTLSWQETVLNGAATVTSGTMQQGDIPSQSGNQAVSVIDNTINASNAAITVSAGASVSISGAGDTVNLGNGSSVSIDSSGSNTVTCGQGTATVTGGSTATCSNGSITVSDTTKGASIDITGSGISVAANGDSVNVADNGNTTIDGSGNTVNVGANDTVSVVGGDNTINITGAGSQVVIGRNDSNGNLNSIENISSQSGSNGNLEITTTLTSYDPITGVEIGRNVQTNDGEGNTTTSSYDANGNLTSYGWQTEGGGSGSNTYGPNGQITSETWNDGNGNSGSNTYDSNGTLESSSWQSNDGHSGTNNYDQNGNLTSDSWQSPDGTTGTDTYNSDGSRASDTWQSTGGSYGSDTYNQDGSVASSSVTTVTTNADGSVTTSTREDNYSTGGGDSYGGGYGGGYGGDYGGGYGGSYGDIYNDTTITTNPDGSSVEVVSTNQYGYGDTTTTVKSADGSYSTTETTAMGITWENSYNATTGEYDNSTIYNDGSRVDNQQQADGTNTSTERDANGNVTRVEVSNGDSDVTTIYQGNGTVSVDTRTGDDHVIETTNPDGSHSETRITNDWNDRITDNYDASGRLTSEDGYNASIPSDNTSSGTISSSWETTYNSDGSSSTHEIEMAGNGQITHDTETDSYGHTVSASTTIEVNGVSDQTTQNADGSHSTAHWDDNGNYDSHQYDADGHDIHDVSRGSDGSYSDQTYDPSSGSTTEDAYNGSTGEHSTYESSYDADGIHHEITTLDRADGSSETQQTDTLNGISLMTDTSSDGTTNYYMNGSGISADQFDQYWQDYFAGDAASNDPGAGDPGTGDPGVAGGSTSATSTDMAAGTTDQQAAA
ncbi:hypothetical protein LMG19083_04711 [Ralstonia psammae]|uniref:Uncharacterized protein n=1 Tax=Ralstonia psammae TaxID=3058598 RepID=A0ABM9JYG3_9RALS|nr:hypothetical protein [Ralstonia sp. LMG 19083]CAJ0808467.1 hypothetical protein LMG19083_04711 [Ralstonia sp. LMG 19083]